VLVSFPFFWRFLTDREEDAVQPDSEHAPDKHH